MPLIMILSPAGASAAPTARRGRGVWLVEFCACPYRKTGSHFSGTCAGTSTTAAEAAGAAISQVLLAALAGGRRNGRERGDGQGQGENDLRHRSSPLGSLCSGGAATGPTALFPVRTAHPGAGT